MRTIQATVNPRLLTKANRLFTGTLQGRIIEILQNARRAGATTVEIMNSNGWIIIRDNGGGIDDFQRLLDLGGSGWDDCLEASEDPAGVGLFCLAPREVTIRSRGQIAVIRKDGWTGEAVRIITDPELSEGTILAFQDELWTSAEVDPNAVFTGIEVLVDGTACPREPFISDRAAAYPELGCRIEVREYTDLRPWHHSCHRGRYGDNVLVNFHGQIVSLHHCPISEHHLHFLIDMTDEPTGIRLMLPARTCLVQNEAYEALLAALELETFRYLHRRGHHRLAYKEYLRAKELGISLPEATPTFHVGLLTGDTPEPIEVTKPDSLPLAGCYRMNLDSNLGDETDEANVHLLAALGKFAAPFVPVDIRGEYDGYSWAKLPTIDKVEFKAGKVLRESWLWSGKGETYHLDALREPKILDADVTGRKATIDDLTDDDRCILLAANRPCRFLAAGGCCMIYPTRPNVCVGMEAGDEQCQEARSHVGLPPLQPSQAARVEALPRPQPSPWLRRQTRRQRRPVWILNRENARTSTRQPMMRRPYPQRLRPCRPHPAGVRPFPQPVYRAESTSVSGPANRRSRHPASVRNVRSMTGGRPARPLSAGSAPRPSPRPWWRTLRSRVTGVC